MPDEDLRVEVVRIKGLTPMEGMDRIELAWLYRPEPHGEPCIVGKEQFEKGEAVVYFPPDHVVPDAREFAFLDKHPEKCADGEKHLRMKYRRIKPMKLRGYVSHGLVLALDEANAVAITVKGDGLTLKENQPGALIGEKLGVTRWEPKQRGGQGSGGSGASSEFAPAGVVAPKYDIDGIRKLGDIFDWEGQRSLFEVVCLEKLHGVNARSLVMRKRGPFKRLRWAWRVMTGKALHGFEDEGFRLYVSSRGVWRSVAKGDSSMWKDVAEKQGLFHRLKKIPGIVVYGEIIGQRAQGADFRYGLDPDVLDLRVFDAYDTQARRWFGWDEVEAMANMLVLRTVPVVARGFLCREDMEGSEEGVSRLDRKTMREGLVVRTAVDSRTARGARAILKIKSEKFLQKHG